MGISGFFGRWNIGRIDVRTGPPAEVFAGRPAAVKVTVKNRRRFLPGFLLRITAEGGTVLFPFIAPGSEETRSLQLTFPSRGLQETGRLHVCSVFPFSFFIRCRGAAGGESIMVYPEPRPCGDIAFPGRQGSVRGERQADRAGPDPEAFSVRNYLPGDPLKYISWKATARTGELKTKEFTSLLHEPVVIDFSKVPVQDQEERISCVTYWILKLLRANVPVGLRIDGTVYEPGVSASHRAALLRALALYGPGR